MGVIFAFDIHGTYQRQPNPLMWNRFLQYANPDDRVDHAGRIDEILKKEFRGEIVTDWVMRKSKKFGRVAATPKSWVRFETEKDFIWFKMQFDGV